jgi:hypothetical protein
MLQPITAGTSISAYFDVNRTWVSREAHGGSRDNAGNRVLAETARPSHILLPAISPDE